MTSRFRVKEGLIDWIEESRRPDVAVRYDYYYVPTIFYGQEKIYEAHPSEKYEDCKRNVKKALDAVLSGRSAKLE